MVKKITVNLALSPNAVEQCDKLASKMGLSRSAFFQFFIETTLPHVPLLEEMLQDISESTSEAIEKAKKEKVEVASKS
jgi:ACT domain-containing protein